jgi:hypothetical protein
VAFHVGQQKEWNFQQTVSNQLTAAASSFNTVGDGRISFTQISTDQVVTINTAPETAWDCISVGITFAGVGASFDRIKVGIWKDANNFCNASVDRIAGGGRWEIAGKIGGVAQSGTVAVTGKATTGFTRIGFMMSGTTVSVWGLNAYGWQQMMKIDTLTQLNSWDPRAENWSSWKWAMFGYCDAGGTQYLFDPIVSHSGFVGLRDMNIIGYEDGTPLVQNGNYYITATMAGPSAAANTLETHRMGIFQVNPNTMTLTYTGRVLGYRTALRGDNAGAIKYDRTSNQWQVFISSWGNYDIDGVVKIYWQAITDDVLHGDVLLNNAALLTPESGNSYDPDIIYVNGQWLMAYSTTASGPMYYKASPTIAGLATATRVQFVASGGEGAHFNKIGGVNYLIYATTTTWQVYKLNGAAIGSAFGTLSATFLSTMGAGGSASPPHATIIPVSFNGQTTYKILTFTSAYYVDASAANDDRSNGDVVVYESQRVQGVEYAALPSRPY